MAGRFVLRRSGDQFFFNLKAAGNHELILTGERYTAKASALAGIEAARANSPNDQTRATHHRVVQK